MHRALLKGIPRVSLRHQDGPDPGSNPRPLLRQGGGFLSPVGAPADHGVVATGAGYS